MLEQATARNGQITLKFNNKWLYSSYNPRNAALAALPEAEPYTLYFCPSPLLGYGLEEWLQLLPVTSCCLFCEQEPELTELTKETYPQWATTHSFWVLPDSLAVTEWFASCQPEIEKCQLIKPSAGFTLHDALYTELYQTLENLILNRKRNKMTLAKNSRRWLKNIKTNLTAKQSWHSPVLRDDPVVLVAAGSSLEEYIKLLRENRGCYRLIAVDTALPSLLAYDLVPDAVFALEGGYYNLKDFMSCYGLNIPLIYDLTAYPATTRALTGKKAIFTTEFMEHPLLALLKKQQVPCLPPLGSVSLSAIGYLLLMGRGPIYLCGFDFAYQLEKTHAKNSYTHQHKLIHWRRLQPYPGIMETMERPRYCLKQNNMTIYTDEVLKNYAVVLLNASNNRIKQLKSQQSLMLPLEEGSLSAMTLLQQPLQWKPESYNLQGIQGEVLSNE